MSFLPHVYVQPLVPRGWTGHGLDTYIQIWIHIAYRFMFRHCPLLKTSRRSNGLILVNGDGTWLACALKEARVQTVHVASYSSQPQQWWHFRLDKSLLRGLGVMCIVGCLVAVVLSQLWQDISNIVPVMKTENVSRHYQCPLGHWRQNHP